MIPAAPISDSGIATIGIATERTRAEKQEDHGHDDKRGFD